MGWENVFNCEIDSFCQKVLKYHFPDATQYQDIKTTDFTLWRGIDILTGGFPCQPFSAAGKRKGTEDDRYLWKEMLRVVREVQPRWVVGENVFGIVNWSGGLVFEQVQTDLEAEGYQVQAYILPAVSVNAPHRRDRVWFVAHAKSVGGRGCACEECGIEEREFQQGESADNRSFKDGEANGFGKKNTDAASLGVGSSVTGKYITGQGQGKSGGCNSETPANTEGLRGDRTQEFENGGGQGGERRGCDPDHDGTLRQGDGDESITNTESQRQSSQQTRATEFQASVGQGLYGGSRFGESIAGDATNSDCGRQSIEEYREAESGRITEMCIPNDWDNFPTQSPVCGGDDGLPDRLVGITFPKWRIESIKAMGNAIVPQVALQIFKAIQEYDNLRS